MRDWFRIVHKVPFTASNSNLWRIQITKSKKDLGVNCNTHIKIPQIYISTNQELVWEIQTCVFRSVNTCFTFLHAPHMSLSYAWWKRYFFMRFKCFFSFSTGQTHARASIFWSKYTTHRLVTNTANKIFNWTSFWLP